MGKIREDNQETVEPYVEKLDDKIKKLNSTRVYKKITPKGDITWYVKWVATILVIIAVVCRSLELHIYDMVFSLLGVIGWTFVGLKWHDRALTILNTVLGVLLVLGIGKYFVQ